MQTYAIASARDWRPAMVDQPFNNVAGHPYIENHTASLAIFNRPGSNRKVSIKTINLRDLGMTTVSGSSLFEIGRISAYSGGTAVEYAELDSNNSALPSQVAILEDLDSVTLVSSSVIRRGLNLPEYNITRAFGNFADVIGERRSGMNNANTYINHNNTAVQNFVLREGEGIAVSPTANAIAYTMKYLITLYFTVGGSTYTVCVNTTTEPRPTFVLFNNSGSGVIIDVVSIEISENGTDEFPTIFSVEGIDFVDLDTAEAINDLTSLDSTNESLTGLVDVTAFARVHLKGYNSGAFMQRNWLRRFYGTNSIAAPNVATGALNFMQRRIDTDKNSVSDIVLNPGDGIGFFKRNGSGLGKFAVSIVFTVETTGSSGGEFGYGFM